MSTNVNIQDIHRLAVCSDLRRNILISLNEGKKPLGNLRDSLKISSSTAIHALRELEKYNLTFQDKNKNYSLTNIGRIIALKLLDFSNATEVLKKHERFWLEHDLSGIPEHMLEKIGWLKDSVCVSDTDTDIFKAHSNFIGLLKNAKEIRGVSSIFVPDYASLFEELIINKKVDVRIVLTQEVIEKIDEKIFEKISAKGNSRFKLYIMKENINVAFTVTDYFFSLGLFRIDRTYDYSHDLISYSKEAIAWGKELFEHYVALSEGVAL